MSQLISFFVLFAIAGTLSARSEQKPFVGTWKLDTARTKYPRGELPMKSATVVIEQDGDKVKVTATNTLADGTPAVAKYTLPANGGAGTILEGVSVDTITSKRPNVNVNDLSFVKNGKEVSSRHSVVSKDGKTMKSTIKGIDPTGKAFAGTEVYEKQ